MENKIVGYLVLGFALLIGFITYLFNRALTDIVNETCTHGPACPMWGTIEFQTNVSLVILAFVALAGLYLVFYGDRPVQLTHLFEPKPEKKPARALGEDESKIFELVKKADGTIFQSELVEQSKFTKVKVTRLLDKLEGQGLVERKRRGMTNVVVLKH